MYFLLIDFVTTCKDLLDYFLPTLSSELQLRKLFSSSKCLLSKNRKSKAEVRLIMTIFDH